MEPDQLSGWNLRGGGHVWVGDGSHERSLWSQRFGLRRPPDEKGTISAFHTGVRIFQMPQSMYENVCHRYYLDFL